MILTLGAEKGGVGKTIIATHLARMRQAAGYDVCLVDADPQLSATDFCGARDQQPDVPRISCIQKTGKSIGLELRGLAGKYDDLIIDTGGRDSVELRTMTLVSDVLLVPINASALNWWTLDKMDEIVGNARLQNPALRAEVLLNRLPCLPSLQRTKVARAVDRIHQAKFQHLTVLNAILLERNAFSNNEEYGLTVFETSQLSPRIDDKACNEIIALYEEIFGERYTPAISASAA